MPIRFGVNFPAWFDANYPPAPPICPAKPNQLIIQTSIKHIKDVYINGLSPDAVIEILNPFSDKEKFFLEITEESQFVSIFEILKSESFQTDLEFEKSLKEWTKKVKEYEKFHFEYEMRSKKYPELLEKFKEAKSVYEEKNLEDELIEKEISKSMIEGEINEIKKKLDDIRALRQNA